MTIFSQFERVLIKTYMYLILLSYLAITIKFQKNVLAMFIKLFQFYGKHSLENVEFSLNGTTSPSYAVNPEAVSSKQVNTR